MSSEYGIRTRVTGVRGQRPRPLDELAVFERANIQTHAAKVNLFDSCKFGHIATEKKSTAEKRPVKRLGDQMRHLISAVSKKHLKREMDSQDIYRFI